MWSIGCGCFSLDVTKQNILLTFFCDIVRQKKERAKLNKEELYFCSYRYRRTVRNKGSPHLVTFNCSDLKIKTERMLAIKEEQHQFFFTMMLCWWLKK